MKLSRLNMSRFARLVLLAGWAMLAPLVAGTVAAADGGVIEGAKEVGSSVGTGIRAAGKTAKEIGVAVGHQAAAAGREVGRQAVKVAKTVGAAAREGSKALVKGIKGGE